MSGTSEFVVVGGGLLGLAAGHALARRGRDVTVLEQAAVGHPGGGSKGSCRIFRLGYPDPFYVSIAQRARGYWDELAAASGERLVLPTPQLTFGTDLVDVRDAMLGAGAPCELLPAAEAAARFPAVAAGGPALAEPDSCVIAAGRALRALAAGVPDLREGVRVTGIRDDGRRVTVRTVAGGEPGLVTARAVVVCAGPWTAGLLAGAGVTLASAATQEQVAYLAPAGTRPGGAPAGGGAPDMPIFICHGARAPYGLPVSGSALYKMGLHHGGPPADPQRQDQRPDRELASRLAAAARRYLPGLDPEPVMVERCVYDNSPDEDFIIDRIGNVVIGCGTSGHGFKFGPMIGDWLARLAAGAPAAVPARFALRRLSAA